MLAGITVKLDEGAEIWYDIYARGLKPRRLAVTTPPTKASPTTTYSNTCFITIFNLSHI